MVVFILFPFYSLRPIARLGHEAVDKAVERSESWARRAAYEDTDLHEMGCDAGVGTFSLMERERLSARVGSSEAHRAVTASG